MQMRDFDHNLLPFRMQALSLKEVHEAEDELDDAAEEAAELQAERLREAEELNKYKCSCMSINPQHLRP